MSFFKKLFGKATATDTPGPSFQDYKNNIFPWIKVNLSEGTATTLTLSGGQEPIHRPWLGDLSIYYVEDTKDSFRVLLHQDLPDGYTIEQLHGLAVSNLSDQVEFRMQQSHLGFYGLLAGGNHEAGAICLPELWKGLAAQLNDSLLVAIPAKDLLLIAPESDQEALQKMKESAAQILQRGERLLTKAILKYHQQTGNWSVL